MIIFVISVGNAAALSPCGKALSPCCTPRCLVKFDDVGVLQLPRKLDLSPQPDQPEKLAAEIVKMAKVDDSGQKRQLS